MRRWLAHTATGLYVIVALRTLCRPRPVQHRWPAVHPDLARAWPGAYRQTIRAALGQPDDRP